MLCNIVMDEIIKNTPNLKGFKMGNKDVKILCYADDAENEDDLLDDLLITIQI